MLHIPSINLTISVSDEGICTLIEPCLLFFPGVAPGVWGADLEPGLGLTFSCSPLLWERDLTSLREAFLVEH